MATKKPVSSEQKLYLVISPGFIKSYFGYTTAILGTLWVIHEVRPLRYKLEDVGDFLVHHLIDAAHRAGLWWAIAMLSSSCCLIQIILNFLSVGCAGFNSVLGKWRPLLLSITVLTQAFIWNIAYSRPFQRKRIIPLSVFSLCLSFLPEIVYWWTMRRSRLRKKINVATGSEKVLHFHIDDMGCISCIEAVSKQIGSISNVLDYHVNLGHATVTYAGEREKVEECVINAIADSGFSATVQRPSRKERLKSKTTHKLSKELRQLKKYFLNYGDYVWSIGVGLLGSSCCILQLGINGLSAAGLVHLGCAGFNKLLGPIRHYVRLFTYSWIITLWGYSLYVKKQIPRKVIRSTAIAIFLTFLPEILRIVGGPLMAPPTTNFDTVELKIEGMGCEACENAVRSVIESSGGVISSSADFEVGRAIVYISRGWGFDERALSKRLSTRGYNLLLNSSST